MTQPLIASERALEELLSSPCPQVWCAPNQIGRRSLRVPIGIVSRMGFSSCGCVQTTPYVCLARTRGRYVRQSGIGMSGIPGSTSLSETWSRQFVPAPLPTWSVNNACTVRMTLALPLKSVLEARKKTVWSSGQIVLPDGDYRPLVSPKRSSHSLISPGVSPNPLFPKGKIGFRHLEV